MSTTPAHTPSPDPSTPEPALLPPLIVICGATATGKTALSLRLAESIEGAEIISADSRQVYRGMDIGTAKVSAAERARVLHHGLDLVDPDQPFTAADYRRAALDALHQIGHSGGVALLVGGTGLYLRAVARGVPLEHSGTDAATRSSLERRLAGEGLHTLVAELRSAAPRAAARTDLNNPRRVVRALERATVHGDRPQPAPRGYRARSVWIGLQADAAENARRVNDRARAQFESGLLEEAAGLRQRYDASERAFSAVGYREAFAVLDGILTTDQAIDLTATRTRQLARRQRTWFRAEPDIHRLDATRDALDAAREIVAPYITR